MVLALLPGCSWVHQRQALDPNGSSRALFGRAEPRRSGRERAPVVKLGVETAPPVNGLDELAK
jgi:hypothetical protein